MKIRVFTAILVCKIIRGLAKLAGRGSSLPGKYALKICPDILSQLKLPELSLAVTGSNGKTSTVEMIAHILRSNGLKVAYNKEGSNQIEGVVTFLISDSTMSGKVKSDVVLLEADERYSRHIFKYFHPKYFVINNLYRDQMTRNGHPEFIKSVIGQAVYDDMTLILNADDPLVASFGKGREGTIYFGADNLPSDTKTHEGIYDDGKYCPVCKKPMEYEYYHYNHIGKFKCTSCGFERHAADHSLTSTQDKDGKASITIDGKYEIPVFFTGIYHCYNILAAFTAAVTSGIAPEKAAESLGGYILKSGRISDFTLGKLDGRLLLSKHENSVSYDRSIDVVANDKRKKSVMIIVDAISRKYYTSDSSWLWDINFEKLCGSDVEKIILAGQYCDDLAVRFELAGADPDKTVYFTTVQEAADYCAHNLDSFLYVITCFSDKEKILSIVTRRELS
jgi:UDP-N-acetylmuramyl tripeptide synthase